MQERPESIFSVLDEPHIVPYKVCVIFSMDCARHNLKFTIGSKNQSTLKVPAGKDEVAIALCMKYGITLKHIGGLGTVHALYEKEGVVRQP